VTSYSGRGELWHEGLHLFPPKIHFIINPSKLSPLLYTFIPFLVPFIYLLFTLGPSYLFSPRYLALYLYRPISGHLSLPYLVITSSFSLALYASNFLLANQRPPLSPIFGNHFLLLFSSICEQPFIGQSAATSLYLYMRATFWGLYKSELARGEQIQCSCRDVHFDNVWLARPLRVARECWHC